jgi:hypothetical protein
MDTAENDATEEQATPDPEPSAPAVETPAVELPAGPVLAEPGMYWCEGEYSGIHPILGSLIHQCENDLTAITHPAELAAIAALVRDGVLMGPM